MAIYKSSTSSPLTPAFGKLLPAVEELESPPQRQEGGSGALSKGMRRKRKLLFSLDFCEIQKVESAYSLSESGGAGEEARHPLLQG